MRNEVSMDEVLSAIAVLQTGLVSEARARLLVLWEALTPDAIQVRTTIAHFLADTEEDPAAELEWDLTALETATGTREPPGETCLCPSVQTFLPSLHLNVADGYLRAGALELSEAHVGTALRVLRYLPEGPYKLTVSDALKRVRSKARS